MKPSSNEIRRPDRSNDCKATFKNVLVYGYRIILFFDPNTQDDLRFNCQPWISQSYYISTFQIYYIYYPDQDFTKLKYIDVLNPAIQKGQSHFDSHTDLTST